MTKGEASGRREAVREQLLCAGVDERAMDEGLGQGEALYSDALFLLIRMRFGPEESLLYWNEILGHLEGMNRALGRDVGLRVAACDYFMNLHPLMREPIIVEVQVLLQTEQGALVDDLTGLYNRRYFNDALSREVERYKRFGQRFSLAMLDVDHFKQFNDAHGHLAGDDALKAVAEALRGSVRTCDHVVRYGGEEFALILPNTDAQQAAIAGERLRQAVEQISPRDAGLPAPLTVSVGLATFPEDAFTARELVARADAALFEAKRTRNAVRCCDDKNRRHPRMDPGGVLALCNGPDQEPMALLLQDISLGGMRCQSSSVILPGTLLEVVLSSAGPDKAARMRLNCRVARLDRGQAGQYELGLSFVLIDEDERLDLVRLVDRYNAAC